MQQNDRILADGQVSYSPLDDHAGLHTASVSRVAPILASRSHSDGNVLTRPARGRTPIRAIRKRCAVPLPFAAGGADILIAVNVDKGPITGEDPESFGRVVALFFLSSKFKFGNMPTHPTRGRGKRPC